MSPLHIGTSDVKINYGVKTAAPTSPSPTEGSEYWHKTKNKKYIYNGTAWDSVNITEPYTGGTSTHWWTQAGLTSNDGWTAEKGSKNLTREAGTDSLTYNSSDSDFNNKKSIGMLSSQTCYLSTSTSGSNGDLWNCKNEGFSIMIVTSKTFNSHSFGVGDALFTQADSWNNSDPHWSFEPCGDHIWHQGGQHWADDNKANIPNNSTLPYTGIYFLKFNSSGSGGAYWWDDGATSWTTLGTASSWPSNGPNSGGTPGITFFMAPHTTASNHRYQGKIADIAYWKGSSISDTERDLYKDWAVDEYGFG